MEKIARITLPVAILLAALVIFIFVDMAQELSELKDERNRLSYELDRRTSLSGELNRSLANCSRLAVTLAQESKDYYDKWQAERTIAYAIWQMFDAATNVTIGDTEYTQVNLLIPREQIDYLRNLSRAYGLNYQEP